jgi:dimethylamine monooxygenase subunit C
MPVSMSHTSMPRWTADFAPPARAVSRCLVVSRGRGRLVEQVLATAPAATVCTPDELAEHLRHARVGWHFVLVGPEYLVGPVRARLLAAGAIDSEISVVLDGEDRRAVYCTHCGHLTDTPAAVGEQADCGGCAAPLAIYHHFSRRLGAYLGYRIDSEEL